VSADCLGVMLQVKAGAEGSKAVRCKALETVGLLIEALAGAGVRGKDTLAYLLPGLVGGLGRELLVTGISCPPPPSLPFPPSPCRRGQHACRFVSIIRPPHTAYLL